MHEAPWNWQRGLMGRKGNNVMTSREVGETGVEASCLSVEIDWNGGSWDLFRLMERAL